MNTKQLLFVIIAVMAVTTVINSLITETRTKKKPVKTNSDISNICPHGSTSVKTNETSITVTINSYPTIMHVHL